MRWSMTAGLVAIAVPVVAAPAAAQHAPTDTSTLLVPARVFDSPRGVTHDGWAVLVRGDRIAAVGPRERLVAPPQTHEIDLPNTTLLPGLIEGIRTCSSILTPRRRSRIRC